MSDPQKAAPGTRYTIKFNEHGKRVEPKMYVVQPRQDCCTSFGGAWHCVTHQQRFVNQLQKDLHVSAKRREDCVLAWFCFEHEAAEEP